MSTKLYHHKTDGGAEYLTDTFFGWKHNGESGREGVVTHDTKICIRLDGQPEVIRCENEAFAELLAALKAIVECPDYKGIKTHEMTMAQKAISNATR